VDAKALIGSAALLLTAAAYYFYFRDIFAGRTKPHAYTWLIWGVLTAIAFAGQVSVGGGPGAWVTGATALISLVICAFAFRRGEHRITRFDKLNLAGAGLALGLWSLTDGPLLSVVLVTLIDLLGFLPTIRKSYHRPHEETLAAYALAGLKFAIALFALESYSVAAWLYPASLVATNAGFVVLLLVWRRRVPEMPL
jgi:hypothetical protein